MAEDKIEETLTLDKRTMDVIVAHIIPTSKYFETRFDHMQYQIDGIKDDLKDFRGNVDGRFIELKTDIDKRFEKVDDRFTELKTDIDKRFEKVDDRFVELKTDIDKRFGLVDKRFEQVDKRFEQIIAAIDRLGDKLENRDEKQRSFTLRMFSIAIAISIIGVLGAFMKSLGII